MNLHIIYRACDKVENVHGKRPYNLKKKETIDACYTSLSQSLRLYDKEFDMTIIGDELTDERIKFFKKYIPEAKIINDKFGNGPSIKKSFEVASNIRGDETVIFFCEDDYFFIPNSIQSLMDLFEQKEEYLLKHKNKDLFVFPWDDPFRYKTREVALNIETPPALIFVSHYNHWREVWSTTFTFLCQKNIFEKYKSIMDKHADRAKDLAMSKEIFNKDDVLLISPIPSLSKHINSFETKPLCFDWQKAINDQLKKIGSI